MLLSRSSSLRLIRAHRLSRSNPALGNPRPGTISRGTDPRPGRKLPTTARPPQGMALLRQPTMAATMATSPNRP